MMISMMEESVNGCSSTNNVTFKSIPSVFLYYDWEWYFYNICMPSIAFFGVVFNLFFILVVFRTPYMYTVTNRYLCNLACSDIFFLCVYTVHKTIELNLSSYNIRKDLSNIGPSYCPVISYMTGFGLCSSTAFITLVTFERFLAICYPFKHLLLKGESYTRRLTILTWFVGGVAACIFVPWEGLRKTVCLSWSDQTSTSIFLEI